MLKSSLRHAARSRPSSHSVPPRPPFSTPIAASFSSRSHQCRHSSSKPPIPPNDGTSNIPASSVKTVGTPRPKDANEKRSSADLRISKRKVAREKAEGREEERDEWTMNLPTVPSTQHLDPKGSSPPCNLPPYIHFLTRVCVDIYVASFFSIHRPMSVSSSVPPSSAPEVIESIFTPKKQTPRQKPSPAEVMYTLASVVQSLEGNVTHQQQQQNQQQQQQQQSPQHQQGLIERADIITALTEHQNQQFNPADSNQPQHLDGHHNQTSVRVPNGIKLVIQEMARRFRPFNAPPVPMPISDAEIEAREAEAAAAEAGEEMLAQQLEQQVEQQDHDQFPENTQHVILMVHENGRLHSRKFFTSHEAPLLRIEDPDVRTRDGRDQQEGRERKRRIRDSLPPFSPTGRVRRGGYPAQRERELRRLKIHAISVKRQRRLKMKKHKYKKLMRKTRNMRRRLDKL